MSNFQIINLPVAQPSTLIIPVSTSQNPIKITGSLSYDPTAKALTVYNGTTTNFFYLTSYSFITWVDDPSNGDFVPGGILTIQQIPPTDTLGYIQMSNNTSGGFYINSPTSSTQPGYATTAFINISPSTQNDVGTVSNSTQTFYGIKFFQNIDNTNFTNMTVISSTVTADKLTDSNHAPVVINTTHPLGNNYVLMATSPTNAIWKLASIGNNPPILSLNGLVSSQQTLTTGTSGNNFNISSAGSTHTFNIPLASPTQSGLITNNQTIGGDKSFTGNITITNPINTTINSPTNTVIVENLYANNYISNLNTSNSNPPVTGQILTLSGGNAIWDNPTYSVSSILTSSSGTINVSTGPRGNSGYFLTQNSSNTATWQPIVTSIRTPTSQDYYQSQNIAIGNITYITLNGNATNSLSEMGQRYSSVSFDPFSMFSLDMSAHNFSKSTLNNSTGPTTRNVKIEFSTSIIPLSDPFLTPDLTATYQIEIFVNGLDGNGILCAINATSLYNLSGNPLRVQLSGFTQGTYNLSSPALFDIKLVTSGSDNHFHGFQFQQTTIKYTILAQ